MMNFKKVALAATCTAMLGGVSGVVTTANAANWLMLQGTEKPGAAPRAKVWGFIQGEYQSTDDTLIGGGGWKGKKAILNQQRPDLKAAKGFNVLRARIGVRGTAMPLDSNVNYFLLAEFGNNGITRNGGGNVMLTDASVTLNHIDGARIRIGQFKTPGSEEGLQAIHVFDYVNFTGATNGLLLERFFDGDGSGTFAIPLAGPATAGDSGVVNKANGPVGAFRDVGVQVFDTFKSGNWEHSYAAMIGNGNGITRGENDDNQETYLYWASELVYGGKGGRRQGLKLYAWNQTGKRTLTGEGAGVYDRDRSGFGLTFRKGKHRAAFEHITADGMIFNGSDGAAVPGTISNPLPAPKFGGAPTDPAQTVTSSWNMATTGEADGTYIHYGYAINNKWEVDARYDIYNRLTNSALDERKFETVTLGAQYFMNKKSRLIFNYEMRDAEAPGWASTAAPNLALASTDDRVSVQILTIF